MKTYRIVRYLGWGLLGLAAGLASGSTLMRLAELAGGWLEWSTVLLPISIDVFAVLSILEWKLGATEHARLHGKRNAWGAIVLSGIGNAVTHLVLASVIPVTWYLTAIVGSVPAVALGLAVHTAVEPLRTVRSKRGSRATRQPENVSDMPTQLSKRELPAATPEPAVAESVPTPSVELETVIQNIRTHHAEHEKPPSRTTYREQFGSISNERFAAAKKVALNGHSTHD